MLFYTVRSALLRCVQYYVNYTIITPSLTHSDRRKRAFNYLRRWLGGGPRKIPQPLSYSCEHCQQYGGTILSHDILPLVVITGGV